MEKETGRERESERERESGTRRTHICIAAYLNDAIAVWSGKGRGREREKR